MNYRVASLKKYYKKRITYLTYVYLNYYGGDDRLPQGASGASGVLRGVHVRIYATDRHLQNYREIEYRDYSYISK